MWFGIGNGFTKSTCKGVRFFFLVVAPERPGCVGIFQRSHTRDRYKAKRRSSSSAMHGFPDLYGFCIFSSIVEGGTETQIKTSILVLGSGSRRFAEHGRKLVDCIPRLGRRSIRCRAVAGPVLKKMTFARGTMQSTSVLRYSRLNK